jgi:hypothetical protein
MENKHKAFNDILEDIFTSEPAYDTIYVGIGTSMKNYDEIKRENNQQFPPFIEDLHEEKRMIILFDKFLEENLAVQKYLGIPKDMVDNRGCYRIIQIDNITIYAINENYYFKNCDDSDDVAVADVDIDDSFLMSIIENRIAENRKLIVQDYSGKNINLEYHRILHLFKNDKLKLERYVNNIIFDITGNDGGCFVNFNKFKPIYDEENNFVNLSTQTMCNIKNKFSEFPRRILSGRISLFKDYIYRYYCILRGTKERLENETDETYYTLIQSIAYAYDYFPKEINIDNLKELILRFIFDIIQTINGDIKLMTFFNEYLEDTNSKNFYDNLIILRHVIDHII